MTPVDLTAAIRRAPKIALHDHLDGGLRPQTIIELGQAAEVLLPATNADDLGRWFFDQADAGSLELYLSTFQVTLSVMQTREQLVRVAKEFVLDQAADGVVYAEARWAPQQHLDQGLSLEETVQAVRDGLRAGMDAAAEAGQPIIARQLLTVLRGQPVLSEVADLAIAYRDDSVVGLDLAGPEKGFPASDYRESFEKIRQANMNVTIHAGEAYGPESIWNALHLVGAHRIGHGVRLIEDIDCSGDQLKLGRLAQYVIDHRIPLEICPTSNLQTGVATVLADHPFQKLDQAGVRVTVNCDNRLMSATTLTREFSLLAETFGYGLADVRRFTMNAAKSIFLGWQDRKTLINEVIIPQFDRLMNE